MDNLASYLKGRPQPPPSVEKVKVAKLVIPVDPELEKQRILEVYGKPMVEALGGAEKIMNFPVVDLVFSSVNSSNFSGPFIRGEFDSHPFISFCYKQYLDKEKRYGYPTCETWIRNPETKTWKFHARVDSCIISPTGGYEELPDDEDDSKAEFNKIADDSIAAKYLLDRLRRLVAGEPIGRLISMPFKKKLEGGIPTDAYLKDKEFTEYWKLYTFFYERDPNGYSEIISWDPSLDNLYQPEQSTEVNKERLRKEYPHQKWKSEDMTWPPIRT